MPCSTCKFCSFGQKNVAQVSMNDWFLLSGSKCQLFIRELWNKNYIRGFISKDEAKDLLLATQRPGTFLIRFAESEKAAITISWLCYLPGSTNMEVGSHYRRQHCTCHFTAISKSILLYVKCLKRFPIIREREVTKRRLTI